MSGGGGRDWAQIYIRLKRDCNDAAALADLFEPVTVWARLDFAGHADREDVVAETCASVVLGIDRAYGAETFDGFVRGCYLNARRRLIGAGASATVPLDEVDPPAAEIDEPSPDELALLNECLGELSARTRRAIELKYLHGASGQEIADALDATAVNARQIIKRGLAALRHSVKRKWPLGREGLP